MVRVYKSSLDLRDDIHSRLEAKDSTSLRGLLARWIDTAPGNTSRLPRFLIFPLQPCGGSTKLCQETLQPTALSRVQTLLGLAAELDLLCYLAEVKSSMDTIPPSSRLKDTSEPAKLLRLETMDGSMAEDASGDMQFGQSFFVPPGVYIDRVAKLPKEKQKQGLVCEFRDLVRVTTCC